MIKLKKAVNKPTFFGFNRPFLVKNFYFLE